VLVDMSTCFDFWPRKWGVMRWKKNLQAIEVKNTNSSTFHQAPESAKCQAVAPPLTSLCSFAPLNSSILSPALETCGSCVFNAHFISLLGLHVTLCCLVAVDHQQQRKRRTSAPSLTRS